MSNIRTDRGGGGRTAETAPHPSHGGSSERIYRSALGKNLLATMHHGSVAPPRRASLENAGRSAVPRGGKVRAVAVAALAERQRRPLSLKALYGSTKGTCSGWACWGVDETLAGAPERERESTTPGGQGTRAGQVGARFNSKPNISAQSVTDRDVLVTGPVTKDVTRCAQQAPRTGSRHPTPNKC
jgi:hypothetical protein